MTYSQLLTLLDETALSPEQLAPILGVSNMSLRRWRKKPGKAVLPKGIERSVTEGIYQLLLEGRLSVESELLRSALQETTPLSFQAALKTMGLTREALANSSGSHQDRVIIGLSQIGASQERRSKIEKSRKRILSYGNLGAEWKERIVTLLNVIKSKKLGNLEKLVAYGALFYLLTPFDLIPDHIPVIGLIDDFGILGFAVSYYLNRFSGI